MLNITGSTGCHPAHTTYKTKKNKEPLSLANGIESVDAMFQKKQGVIDKLRQRFSNASISEGFIPSGAKGLADSYSSCAKKDLEGGKKQVIIEPEVIENAAVNQDNYEKLEAILGKFTEEYKASGHLDLGGANFTEYFGVNISAVRYGEVYFNEEDGDLLAAMDMTADFNKHLGSVLNQFLGIEDDGAFSREGNASGGWDIQVYFSARTMFYSESQDPDFNGSMENIKEGLISLSYSSKNDSYVESTSFDMFSRKTNSARQEMTAVIVSDQLKDSDYNVGIGAGYTAVKVLDNNGDELYTLDCGKIGASPQGLSVCLSQMVNILDSANNIIGTRHEVSSFFDNGILGYRTDIDASGGRNRHHGQYIDDQIASKYLLDEKDTDVLFGENLNGNEEYFDYYESNMEVEKSTTFSNSGNSVYQSFMKTLKIDADWVKNKIHIDEVFFEEPERK